MRFRRLAMTLHLGPACPVFMLKAYFDDSGNGDQAVGGCIASVESWDDFETAWSAVLADFHVQWFHATDFEQEPQHRDEHRVPGYGPMSDDERQAFRVALLKVLNTKIGIGLPRGGYVSSIVEPTEKQWLNALDVIDKRGNKRGRDRSETERITDELVAMTNDPYCACVSSCLYTAVTEFAEPLDETIFIFLAHQPKRTGLGTHVYAMATSSARYGRRFAGIRHGLCMNPREVVPLQGADYAAYYMAKAARNPSHDVASWVNAQMHPQKRVVVPFTGWASRWLS